MEGQFATYSDRVLELLNHVFSTAYQRVERRYWNNTDFARVKKNYCVTDWEHGIYEVYLPTFFSAEKNMNYYRIAIKTIPELDPQVLESREIELSLQNIKPAGQVDSQLLVVAAPYRKRGFIGFLFGRRRPGPYGSNEYKFLAPVITPIPEEAVKRILKIVSNFIRKRIRAMLNSFHLEDWFYQQEERLYYTSSISVLDHVSDVLTNALRCLSHLLSWFLGKLSHVEGEVVRQVNIKSALGMVQRLRKVLEEVKFTPSYLAGEEPPLLKQLIPILIAR